MARVYVKNKSNGTTSYIKKQMQLLIETLPDALFHQRRKHRPVVPNVFHALLRSSHRHEPMLSSGCDPRNHLHDKSDHQADGKPDQHPDAGRLHMIPVIMAFAPFPSANAATP